MSDDLYDPYSNDTTTIFLARFVQEARPLLLQRQQEALAAFGRWRKCRDEQAQQETVEARRQAYLLELAALPVDPRHDPASPVDGMVWLRSRVFPNKGEAAILCGWGPPELSDEGPPPAEYPLPPPLNRDLSPDERWVALLAVHDAVRDPRERFVLKGGTAFIILCGIARALTEEQVHDLRVILEIAKGSVAQPPKDTQAPTTQVPSPVTTPSAPTDSLLARHSSDFRSVRWYGVDYCFTEAQAAIVAALWKAWENGTPELGARYLLGIAKLESDRLPDVFKEKGQYHPAWGTMIQTNVGSKGAARLCPPKNQLF